jgi:uncharacterized protein (DUF2252 family)
MAKSEQGLVEIADRPDTLRQCRNLKMASSAHAYVRGNTFKFYEWLDTADTGKIPQGPPIWICGDCHIGNLGPLADTDGKINIEIRDLDQTVIGNPAHDLIRLALSLAMAARGSDLPGVTTAKMIEEIMLGYEEALAEKDPDLRRRRPKCVQLVMRQAVGRTWENLANERIEDEIPAAMDYRRQSCPLCGINLVFITTALRLPTTLDCTSISTRRNVSDKFDKPASIATYYHLS